MNKSERKGFTFSHWHQYPKFRMDPKHAPVTLDYLEKQNEVLMDSFRLFSDKSHKLQVEDEMMMTKYYELMCADCAPRESQNKENVGNLSDDRESRNDRTCYYKQQ